MADSISINTIGEFSPALKQVALNSNYIDFNSVDGGQWAQQYMPDLYEAEVERYGNRSISSFLRMVGAESPMTADQVIWSEQGRLHLHYSGKMDGTDGNKIDGLADHVIRVGQTVVIGSGATVKKAYVKEVAAAHIIVAAYDGADLGAPFTTDNTDVKLFVFGSEFAKGQLGMSGAVEPKVQTFTNNPIILKDKYEVSGSDVSQIGWIEITGEGGQTGYLWYLKALGDTRVRFEDYLEMTMMEAEKAEPDSAAEGEGLKGTEGYFAAVTARGHVASNVFDSSTDLIADFDVLLQELDKQGAIQENMLFLNRAANLKFDDALAGVSLGSQGGTAYGVFNNSEDMALNLGFSGFRRGSYDFYKTDWKYLNDFATRGQIGDIKGTLVPAGTSTVYDQILGKNIKRPFLHVRYRASQADNRKMKSWTTGSVGASTSDLDAMEVHFLSERCLVVQGANNFVTFK